MVYGKHNVVSLDGFKAGLKEKGYVEGKNIIYLFNGPLNSIKGVGAKMEQLVAQKPDLIFSATTPVSIAAMNATRENAIPVVFGPTNDPVKSGLVKTQKRPGGNMTGVMLTASTAKQLEWTLSLVPDIKNILFPFNPEDGSSVISMEQMKTAAATFGLNLIIRETRNHAEIDALIANCPDGIDAIFLPRDGMLRSRVEDFAELARRKKIVLSGTRLEMAEEGALFSFGFDGFELGRQMARLAALILNGKNPGDLPVETAEDYLAINLKTAQEMGITIDEHILRQAHKIIRP
ncbi:MAG: ABC transporter substrate-binding protein [Desulfobulbaceae bacterium]|nr:ABC transporter substrate-binding protein [Desulfobulbaceae bacterium]